MAEQSVQIGSVFLSASVPDPQRDPKYFETGDSVAIRNAVIALVTVVLPRTRLVFGGHPAITPMVKWVADQIGAFDRVRMFQSMFFRDAYLKDIKAFRYEEVEAVPGDREASLLKMRMRMIQSEPFRAAFFIGGMNGVEDEYALLKLHKPAVPCFPVETTGAAARLVCGRELDSIAWLPDAARKIRGRQLERLQGQTSYVALFTNLLEEIEKPSGAANG